MMWKTVLKTAAIVTVATLVVAFAVGQFSNKDNSGAGGESFGSKVADKIGTSLLTGAFTAVGSALAKPAVDYFQAKGWLDIDLMSVMSSYTEDLTEKARDGRLHDAICRNKEIEDMIDILSKKEKKNICVVGEAGVGKTALVEGLAYRIATNNVPEHFKNKKIIKVKMVELIAGNSYQGSGPVSRMRALFNKAKEDKDMILFIDEFHQIVNAGAAELFKSYLDRDEISIIAATTTNEFKYIDSDDALKRRFTRVLVEEPTPYEALEILKGLASDMENEHKVKINESAMIAAVDLTERYMKSKTYPDKALDVLRTAIANVLREKGILISNKDKKDYIKAQWPVISEKDIAKVVSSETNIPIGEITSKEKLLLETMEERIKFHLVGQDRAIKAVCDAVKRGRAGINDPKRPRASFLFVGQAGVGKTTLAELIGAEMSGTISIDLTNYNTQSSLSELLGAKVQGYKGELISKIWKNPYSVVLFENIEKADPYVLSTIFNVAQQGYLIDNSGSKIDFSNSVMIFTTSIGENLILNSCDNESYESIQKKVITVLENVFTSELDKIDDIIVFDKFKAENVKEVLSKFVYVLENQLSKANIGLTVDISVLDHLSDSKINNKTGARQLRKIIQEKLEKPISDLIIKGELDEYKIVNCTLDGKKEIKFTVK